MKTSHIFTATSLALAAWLASTSATAQTDSPKTREQVRQELQEAVRTGNMPSNESGRLLREINPSRYPPAPNMTPKTREQVKAELQEAVRTGNVVGDEESGMLEREIHPSRYPAPAAGTGKTREQVQQELREAIRTEIGRAHV